MATEEEGYAESEEVDVEDSEPKEPEAVPETEEVLV